VELTGYDFERQHRVHLLCYYPDIDCPALREHCAIMKERRNACALQSAKELEQLYPQFTTDLAWETTKASGVLFKSGLMQALELLGAGTGKIRVVPRAACERPSLQGRPNFASAGSQQMFQMRSVSNISPSISKITPCIITQAPFGERSTYILYCTMFFRF